MLENNEIERYARHLMLKEIGGAGQAKLKTARVLVIGAGGLGAPLLLYLAAAGIGTLGMIDDDVVSLSNLQRQVLYQTQDIGKPKVLSAKSTLKALNSHVTLEAHQTRITAENAASLIENYDFICDGSDNFATRYAVADCCEKLHKPLLTAAVGRFDANMTLLKPYENNNPSYRCLFPDEPPRDMIPACSENGVLGALTGVIGTMMALEVIKDLCGFGETIVGKLILIDTLTWSIDKIGYERVKE